MFGWIISLFFIATVLLLAELFLPGFGIFGFLGLISSCLAIILTANIYGIFYMFVSIVLFVIMILITIYFLRRKNICNKIILNDNLNEDISFKNDFEQLRDLIGKKGITITPLKPFGRSDIDGKIIEVYSDKGYILENRHIKVINIENHNIIVREVDF